MRALHDLVASGKVRYLGASSMWTYQFARYQTVASTHGWTPFVSMQNHYSLAYREEEREMNKFCRETGVGRVPGSPLFQGVLARPLEAAGTVRATGYNPMGRPLTEADRTIVARVEEVAAKRGWKMSQVALVWLRQKGAVPITGITTVERMEEACAMKGKTLTEEEVKYLEEPYVPKEIVGHH